VVSGVRGVAVVDNDEVVGDEQSDGDDDDKHDFSFRGVTGGMDILLKVKGLKTGFSSDYLLFLAKECDCSEQVQKQLDI